LKNGVRPGTLARVYLPESHELRFVHVVSLGQGLNINATVQYLDGAQEPDQVLGMYVHPLTRGWLEDMKDRLEAIQDIFEPGDTTRSPVSRQLANGVRAGSLIRVYSNHSLRFARVTKILGVFETALILRPNVVLQYLDDDREEDEVFGSKVQPISQAWVDDFQQRLQQADAELTTRRRQTA
jgi:hypothetical protein